MGICDDEQRRSGPKDQVRDVTVISARALTVRDLVLSMGPFQLGPLSVSFEGPGLYFIRGKNGSGKTSFLRAILGRLRQSSGVIVGVKHPIGASGVEPLLMGSWTVAENHRWFAELLKSTASLPGEISHLAPQRADHLSQGMKRQVELSLLFSLSLPTLFLDEPLNPLDRNQREIYAKKIKEASQKSLVLLTTHTDEAMFGTPKGALDL